MRKLYSSFDKWGMDLAIATSKRSKDPSTQVGCVIVDDLDGSILGTGYNKFPDGEKETARKWSKKTKHKYVIHAEVNAIDDMTVDNLAECRDLSSTVIRQNLMPTPEGDLHSITPYINIYTTLFPCEACAKYILTHFEGILRKIHFIDIKDRHIPLIKIFEDMGVEVAQVEGTANARSLRIVDHVAKDQNKPSKDNPKVLKLQSK